MLETPSWRKTQSLKRKQEGHMILIRNAGGVLSILERNTIVLAMQLVIRSAWREVPPQWWHAQILGWEGELLSWRTLFGCAEISRLRIVELWGCGQLVNMFRKLGKNRKIRLDHGLKVRWVLRIKISWFIWPLVRFYSSYCYGLPVLFFGRDNHDYFSIGTTHIPRPEDWPV